MSDSVAGVEGDDTAKDEPKEKANDTGKIVEKEPYKYTAGKDEQAGWFERLVRQLGSDDWRVREQASEQLKKAGKKALPFIFEFYPATDDEEVRVRLKQAAEFIYTNYIGPGFLGVGHVVLKQIQDDRIPKGQCGVLVERVVPRSPADGRLFVGDLILQIDDVKPPADAAWDWFVNYIASREIGQVLKLRVLRDAKILSVRCKLGPMPPETMGLLRAGKQLHGRFQAWWNERLKEAAKKPSTKPETRKRAKTNPPTMSSGERRRNKAMPKTGR